MPEIRINLIDGIYPKPSSKKEFRSSRPFLKRFKFGKLFFRLSVFILVITIVFSTQTIFSSQSILTNLGKLSFWEGVARLVTHQDKILKGESEDRVNILLLGMGGEGHEGAYLTDTIILFSLKPSTNQVALISIPRDLYVPIPGFGWRKINNANAFGMAKSKDGAVLTSQTVSQILDLPIHYWVRVDFQIFKDLIDWLGGIEIEVERSFVDLQYPTPDFKYQTVAFEKGWQKMDGDRALQYVRSRHGNNNEGSDFARARRQQKVLFAVKERVIKDNLIYQPQKIWQAYNIFRNRVTTNLDLGQIIRLAKIGSNIQPESVKTEVLEAGPDKPLYAEIALDGAYILKPKAGNFGELAQIAQNIFNKKDEVVKEEVVRRESTLLAAEEKLKIVILNGTYINGLAQRTANNLANGDYQIILVGNAPMRNYEKNVIYNLLYQSVDVSANEVKTKHLNNLKESLKAEIETELPANLKFILKGYPDLEAVVVLGKESL